MARGWESKSVEDQMDTAQTEAQAAPKKDLTPEEAELQRKKDSLVLSRARVLHDLEASQNPRHQQILRQALAELEARLAQLD